MGHIKAVISLCTQLIEREAASRYGSVPGVSSAPELHLAAVQSQCKISSSTAHTGPVPSASLSS
jgi:hypothetical protein